MELFRPIDVFVGIALEAINFSCYLIGVIGVIGVMALSFSTKGLNINARGEIEPTGNIYDHYSVEKLIKEVTAILGWLEAFIKANEGFVNEIRTIIKMLLVQLFICLAILDLRGFSEHPDGWFAILNYMKKFIHGKMFPIVRLEVQAALTLLAWFLVQHARPSFFRSKLSIAIKTLIVFGLGVTYKVIWLIAAIYRARWALEEWLKGLDKAIDRWVKSLGKPIRLLKHNGRYTSNRFSYYAL